MSWQHALAAAATVALLVVWSLYVRRSVIERRRQGREERKAPEAD